MTLFKVNDTITFVCYSENTRSGFKHIAVLCKNGSEIDREKVFYQDRTGEAWTYEAVLNTLIDKTKHLSDLEKELCVQHINK